MNKTIDLNGKWALRWHDGDSKLADNFFDVFPGQPHTIPWPFRTPPCILFVGNQIGK